VLRGESDGKKTLLATLGPGEYFGEMALLSKQQRTATVMGRTRGSLVSVKRGDFKALLSYFPDLSERFRQLVESRMGQTPEKNQSNIKESSPSNS
jgi:CRP-like cAMP-binding protein